IDGALKEKERLHFEFRLQESVELKQALEAHRLLQWNLRHLPKPKLPHNFTLTRAEAQAIKRQKAWIPVFSTASLASFLLLAAMFVLPLFRPAASPAPQILAMEPSLSAPMGTAADESMKAQVAPEAAPLAEAAPTEQVPAPLADSARSNMAALEPVQIFTFGAQATGKGGGGGGDASLAMGGGGGVDANLYPIAQPAGNPGTFGNAPYGIVVPVEPLFGMHPGSVRGQDYDLQAILAPTPSLPPLILGMNTENAGKIIFSDPALPANIEPMGAASTAKAAESFSAPAEIPLPSPEPGLAAETPETSSQVPARAPQTSTLSTILKIAAGVLTLLFAGLALYFKKH
ncbi:MAG TPA: hypothetical protein VLR89_07400, partial [Anaerolineaceae bacterium]|nr:hypothetical protein [Anaerolineaceae bacterium]